MSHHRVVVNGYYGRGNIGDDVLALAAIGLARELCPPAEIAVVAAPDGYLRRWVPDLAFVDRRELAAHTADLFVYGGGTQFFSFEKTRRRGLAFLKKRLAGLRRRHLPMAARRGAALGVGVGPFVAGSLEERRAAELFRRLDFVAVRDETSLATVRAWGCGGALLGADLAYLSLGEEPAPAPRAPTGRVGLVVRDWPHTEQGASYAEPLLEAAARLRAAGTEVELVLLSLPDDPGWRARIRDGALRHRAWDPEAGDPAAFVAGLRDFDVVVTARYHGALFAALAGIPTVFVEIEPKLAIAAAESGGDAPLWRPPFDAGELVSTIARLRGDGGAAAAALRAATARKRAAALAMRERFLAFGREALGDPGGARDLPARRAPR